jgi:2-methylcitrate dehydratase PrpD
MGTAFLAARLSGLSGDQMRDAIGITGNMASGINQSWVDGTHAQFVDSGWAAAAGITAARLAMAGMDGPAQVLEGRFGLFRGYVQDPSVHLDFARMVQDFGQHWNALDIEIKRYPTGHVNLPFVEAMLQLHDLDGIRASQVSKISASVAKWMMPVVCEPADEKRRPRSDLHAKVSLPYTLAETLCRGRLGAGSITHADLADPEILALVDKVECVEDLDAPSSDVYKGAVTVELADGRRFERIVRHGKGLVFSDEQLRAKFDDCLSYAGHQALAGRLWDVVQQLDDAPNLNDLSECLAILH